MYKKKANNLWLIVFAENGFRALNSNSAPNSVKRNGNKYFKDTVSGINGLRELRELQKTGEIGQVYVGFIGGTKALEEQDIEKLENRPYKWDETLENKLKVNWIPIEEFIAIVDKKNMNHES